MLSISAACFTGVEGQGVEAQAAPVLVLKDGRQAYMLGKYLEYLEDESQALTFEQIRSPEFGSRFTPGDQDTLNFGFRDSAYWIRFRVRSEASDEMEWLIELAEPPMNSVTLYTPAAEPGKFIAIETGYIYPVSTRDLPDTDFVFSMEIEPGQELTYYMRVQDIFINLPLRIWSREAFEVRRHASLLVIGMSFGALSIMLIYNLFLAITLRDKGYYYYTFFQGSLLLYLASVSGYGPFYLWPGVTWFNPFIISLLIGLLLISLLLFAGTFLLIDSHAPRLKLIRQVLILMLAMAILPTPWLGSVVLYALIPLAFIVLAYAALAGIWVWRGGYRPALYYLVSWSLFFFLGMAMILERMSVLNYGSLFTEHGLQLGAVFAVAVQSLALADRINLYKSVANRSRDLSDVNAKLAQMIAERILAQEQLEVLARTDPLCGLYNRRHFFTLAEAAFKKAARYNRPLSVILFDIDNFKIVNDTYGHNTGDQALIHVAGLTRLAARDTDIVARHGGDEFILLLPETDEAAAVQAAERLRQEIENTPIQAEGHTLTCTVTLGVAGNDSGGAEHFDQMLIWADQALYQAKESGRNKVLVFRRTDT